MAFYDHKTGEEIRPFGYELDSLGRPVQRKLAPLSRHEYAAKYGLALCVACEALLNAAGECEDCASGRQD
jgi:hypothetical protein